MSEIRIVRDYPHPPAKVWRAVTDPALIPLWTATGAGGRPEGFAPVVGTKFTFIAKPKPGWNGVVDCEVLAVEPNRELSYTWGALGAHTVVTLTLTPTSTGTHLRMEQTGFPADRPQNFQGAKFGWQKFLANLEQVVARKD